MQTPDPKNCEPVFDKVEQWKKQLLDLTRRNKLLYLTESKAKRLVEITSPDVGFLLDTIVNGGHSLSFPMPAHRQLALDTASQVENPEQEMAVRRGGIETTLPVAELSRALYRLRRDWLTWQEEQGIHTLFLTIGLLTWKDANFSDEEFLAPIILLPGLRYRYVRAPP